MGRALVGRAASLDPFPFSSHWTPPLPSSLFPLDRPPFPSDSLGPFSLLSSMNRPNFCVHIPSRPLSCFSFLLNRPSLCAYWTARPYSPRTILLRTHSPLTFPPLPALTPLGCPFSIFPPVDRPDIPPPLSRTPRPSCLTSAPRDGPCEDRKRGLVACVVFHCQRLHHRDTVGTCFLSDSCPTSSFPPFVPD